MSAHLVLDGCAVIKFEKLWSPVKRVCNMQAAWCQFTGKSMNVLVLGLNQSSIVGKGMCTHVS